jgi:hypothetical protein
MNIEETIGHLFLKAHLKDGSLDAETVMYYLGIEENEARAICWLYELNKEFGEAA